VTVYTAQVQARGSTFVRIRYPQPTGNPTNPVGTPILPSPHKWPISSTTPPAFTKEQRTRLLVQEILANLDKAIIPPVTKRNDNPLEDTGWVGTDSTRSDHSSQDDDPYIQALLAIRQELDVVVKVRIRKMERKARRIAKKGQAKSGPSNQAQETPEQPTTDEVSSSSLNKDTSEEGEDSNGDIPPVTRSATKRKQQKEPGTGEERPAKRTQFSGSHKKVLFPAKDKPKKPARLQNLNPQARNNVNNSSPPTSISSDHSTQLSGPDARFTSQS
jgi:hypothetical protein